MQIRLDVQMAKLSPKYLFGKYYSMKLVIVLGILAAYAVRVNLRCARTISSVLQHISSQVAGCRQVYKKIIFTM